MPKAYRSLTPRDGFPALTEEQREAARRARQQYQRTWRKQNRDKVREIQLRYWLRKAAAQNDEAEQEAEQ